MSFALSLKHWKMCSPGPGSTVALSAGAEKQGMCTCPPPPHRCRLPAQPHAPWQPRADSTDRHTRLTVIFLRGDALLSMHLWKQSDRSRRPHVP